MSIGALGFNRLFLDILANLCQFPIVLSSFEAELRILTPRNLRYNFIFIKYSTIGANCHIKVYHIIKHFKLKVYYYYDCENI